MPDQPESPGGPGPDRLSEMLGLEPDCARLWRADELAAVFRHQMAAPIAFDLGGADPTEAHVLRVLSEAQGLLIKSFGDLLRHPSPPIELLELTKDFAKANREHPEAVLPHQIAHVLYYASIAAALVRCGIRITQLSDSDLRHGFSWASSQPWVDAPMKELLAEALARILETRNGL